MPRNFSQFDKFKRSLSKRWDEISVYNTTDMYKLVVDGFKPFVYSLMNIGLNVNDHLNQAFKQIEHEYLCFKITKKNKIKKDLKYNLDFFLKSVI